MERLSFYLLLVLLVFPHVVKLQVPKYLQAKYGVSQKPNYIQSGVKTKTKTAPVRSPASKFRGGCKSEPPKPPNAGIRCSQYSGCRADCENNYQFPNGATQLFITCENGQWIIEGGMWTQVPSCQPICTPPCQNQGICVAPNQCECPENFSGPYCQFEEKPCMNYPILPTNSRRSCSQKTCTISCLRGHQFPDGSSIATISCKNGFWIPDKEKWKQLPDCEPTCNPPCLNGGNCLSFNQCHCPQNFRGSQCQYSTENCNPQKLLFNGGYNCSGDQSRFSCALQCPEGMKFESTPSYLYTCLYEEAFFKPQPIPQCIFPENVQGTIRQTSSHNYYQISNHSGFNLKSLSVNGLPPELSYIPAGQRWNTYDLGMSKTNFYDPGNDLKFATISPYNIKSLIFEKLPEPGICITWQGTHYKTFDGKIFSFDSKCAYTLVQDSVDNTFSVTVQTDPNCSQNPLTCSRIIRIYFDKKEYILQRLGGVPVFGNSKKRFPIPGQLPGLRVEMSAHFIIVSLDAVGSKIKWDGQQLVQVEVQESLWNRTQGLCGSLDNDFSNDIVTKSGHKSQTISNFASRWKIENLESDCNDLPSENHPCGPSKNIQAEIFCQKLLNDPRFAPCHPTMDISLLLDACKWDFCSCQDPDPSTCACETMNVYVRACSYNGVKDLANWRDEKTCPMQCSGGKIYKPCAPSTGQPVCGETSQHETDQGCIEGCYCPEGTVLHENKCITKDKCPCRLRTKSFPPGTEIPKECNTCTCSEGKWVCTKLSCGSRCAAVGDPHYQTFDGRRFDFMGQCSYYLVKTESFSIEGENVACSGAISQAMNLPISVSSGLPSCTKAVTVRIFGQVIKLKQNHDIVVNGRDITKVPYQIGNVTIRSVSSIFLQVELPNGMIIWWDGSTRAYIDIPANFPEKTRGLCGTFTNNQKDDFLTPENDIEQAVIPFANKWKTNEKCNDVPDLLKSHPCSTNIHNQPTAEKHCQKLKSDLFSSCHWIVDPEPFYQDCLYDMCSCEFKISKCLCPTLAAYAEECSRQGVKISWRDDVRECGVHCPSGQKYQICGNTCTRTCFDISTRPDCKPQCVEGCNCPPGEALDDEGECVPIGDCKCNFDGLQFHPGYKEVRPASKRPEICTCINAMWSCHLATPEEQKAYPKANDLKSLCSATENMEFTTCEPPEPLTCKNMHSLEYFSAGVCHAGCKCKEGFVLDTTSKKCVRPDECPCHHGGRSYKENEVVRDDCNTCKCQNGKWKCSDRPCSSECSAWGDSHFKTFDGRHYDFQGQCDYVMSKGVIGSDSFEISIQNVPCGSLGTSCSKSVTIRVKSGEDQDILTLTRDKKLPDFTTMKHITVRQKGLFVIIEAPDLGLTVQWDKGTRVYIKIDPRWKDRVKGLCGNYNDNGGDDFQTPSGGLTEASAKIFGDSWKIQSYCPEALEITNTCEDRPDRKVWALKQCGILKSTLFASCHSEVPVDIFHEKCVFDSCACDQGGDCECLCTALAAYAQECNTRGVSIKWRSQKLCPMQCDERCSNYSPCISTCPTETCDNLLTQPFSKTCKEDTCIEGCVPKPCPPDHIYLNSSMVECVPRNVCKPICMEIQGVTYFEGDLVEGDDCYSCFCSRGNKICKGQPCTTTPLPTTHQLEQIVKCESGWSDWINQDRVKPSKSGSRKKKTDYEPVPTPLILNNLKGGKCDKDKMIDIECRTVKTRFTPKQTGLDVECSLENGLICKSGTKGKTCQDFEIRVLCQCEETTTVGVTPCDPVKPHKEHPTNCHIFYHCENSPSGPKYVEKTCGPSMYYNPVTMICDWPYAVEEIKPECKQNVSEVEPEAEIGPQQEEDAEFETVAPVETAISKTCPPGTQENECAIQCDQLCLYYSHIVKMGGKCENNEKCEHGCVKIGKNSTCPKGMFWASEDSCVSLEDCLCRSNDGKPVKPGTVYRESDCRVCQCINNYYTCDESECEAERGRVVASSFDYYEIKKTKAEIEKPTTVEVPLVPITVTPPEKCSEDHFIDLVQGDQALPNVLFNASSVLSPAFKPEYAKFNSKVEIKSGGSWVPEYSNNLQFLEINLGQQEPIYGVKIKGSPLYDEYVTSYKMTYSPDSTGNFYPVLNKDRLPQVFRGSIDATTPVREIFDTPFEAQIVRIYPETWHVGIALRVELIGCGEPSTTTVMYEFITVQSGTTSNPEMCDDPMGLDDGMMSDQQISVSSEMDKNHTKANLKLGGDSVWQPVTNSPTEFIQFDFLEPRNLTGIETKGGPEGWVSAYIVQYSQDNKIWNPILDRKTTNEKLYLGNFDSNSPQINHFELPINARLIKLVPKKWYENIQMRVEIHGCYEPYPTLPEQPTTLIPSACNYCPGVTTDPLELHACRCKPDKWWDGENCVSRTECPCLVGHISYPVGTSFKKEDCSECLCKIGGVTHCTPKQCENCEKGLRSTVTSTCKCTCQPCPENTILCPTSNICINTTLWCNGVQDCPDDEITCPTTVAVVTTTPTPKILTTEKSVKKCPELECPSGFRKQIKRSTKGRKYQSSMFSNYAPNYRKNSYKGQAGGVKNGIKTNYRKTTLKRPPPPQNQNNCTEYVCISTKPAPKYMHSKKECPPAMCPEGYVPVFENEDFIFKQCPEYTCELASKPDAVCNVTGRTFNTFDNTEFKYDICNHILARDLENDEWEVTLRKTCLENCWRDLVIHHQDHLFVLHPNLTAEYDGFSYTVEQTKKIGSNTQAFALSRLGNTILFVSNRYGFWVIWDKEGNVKLGVTRKLVDKVDGLCGYFNEESSDDKKKPDGSLARTTVEFGDSWANVDQMQSCEPQVCPLHIQNKAWEICQVKEQSLEPCTRVIDKDSFISRCIETTCDCLQAAAKNQTAENECRCHSLENFVVECLTREPNLDISDWRLQLDCPVSCEAPLVYHDCYQRKCEPTCESLSNPEAACPKLPNVCFPGCYCPSGMVKKGDTCISPSNCRDCECNVLPHLQYVTYDESNFTINANCVYVMSRDISDKDNHKFQVLITNAPCKTNEKKTCVGKVTILYQGRKIHILNDMIRNKLKLIVDGEKINDFAEITWAEIRETSSKHLKIHLIEVQIEISVYYPSLGVSVKAPSTKYGGKLEGLCGNCDNNPLDDFRTPSGTITNDTNEFALSWLYDKLPGGQSKEMCQNKQEDCPPLPKNTDPCNLILDYKIFGQCLRVLDPSLFLEWCRKDTCGDHPELACNAIEAYARDCSSAGFCIDWRTNICPKTCPSDKIYNPCGTKCPKTCDSIKEKEKSCASLPVEGCFCPEGLVLRNETCVLEKDCEVCDEEGHHPGDTWKKDKCTTCTCEGISLKCETEHCSKDKICEQGYQIVRIPGKEDECCDKYACVPEPTSGPTCEPPQVISCGPGQVMKLSAKGNGCQQFICECKPVEECEPVLEKAEPLEDGLVQTIDLSGCCPEAKIICKKELCPKAKDCPQFHVLKNETGKCCPFYSCEPPKNKCIYEYEYTSDEKGGERVRTEMEKQKVLKKGNDTWQDGPCRTCTCSQTSLGNYQSKCTQTDCSAIELSQDYLDYELEPEFVYDQCCPNIKRVACKHDQKVYKVGEKWTIGDDFCTVFECVNGTSGVQKETQVKSCDKDCELGFEYIPAKTESRECCGGCKQYACVVEGKIYKIGEEWTSDDFCTRFSCLNTNGSIQVQSSKITCPELPSDYTDNFVVETIPVENECCKKHKTTACKVEGKIYQVGEMWPSPDGDKCKKITCVKNKKEEISKQESVETCKTNCSKGFEYKKSNDSCCGECVRVACIVDEKLKKPGENWTSPDNCTTFTCEQFGNEFIVSSQQESCPSLENCPEENIYIKGCCKHCNITSAPQQQCSAEAISLNKTLGLLSAHRGGHGKCTNKKPIDEFTECVGSCHSATFYNANKGSHESICSCCQATDYKSLEVELECEDGHIWKKKVAVPSECGCEGCAAAPKFIKTKKASFVKS